MQQLCNLLSTTSGIRIHLTASGIVTGYLLNAFHVVVSLLYFGVIELTPLFFYNLKSLKYLILALPTCLITGTAYSSTITESLASNN